MDEFNQESRCLRDNLTEHKQEEYLEWNRVGICLGKLRAGGTMTEN